MLNEKIFLANWKVKFAFFLKLGLKEMSNVEMRPQRICIITLI